MPAALGCELASSVSQIFSPDSVWNYEVGAKLDSPDRLFTLNGAAYRIKQKGIQISIPDPCGSTFFANAGDARIDGAELEVHVRPSSYVTLSGQASYADTKFTDVPLEFGEAAGYAEGDPTPETPRWKFALSSEVRYPVTDAWEAYVRGSWQHVGKTPFALNGLVSSGRFRPAYDIANFDIGAQGSKVDISLFIRNAFNKRGILSIGSGAVGTIPDVFENVTFVTPRAIGITARFKR